MSHVSTLDVVIDDLDALKKACELVGLEFVEGQRTFRWYGRWMNDYAADDAAYKNGIKPEDYGKCEHAIRIPGNSKAYEIGVARRADGKLTLVWDFYCGGFGLEEKIGKTGGLLRREYALQVGMKAMQKKGFKTSREVNTATGKPRMRAYRIS